MSHFGHDVNEKSVKSPCGTGKQHIVTPDRYIIPLDVVDGLPYMKLATLTEEDTKKYPQITLTSHMVWEPQCMDHSHTDAN